MDLDGFLGPNPIVVDLYSEGRLAAIDELIGHLADTQKIQVAHKLAIAAVVRERENAMSTGIGFGIAIPHTLTNWFPTLSSLVAA